MIDQIECIMEIESLEKKLNRSVVIKITLDKK